MRSLALSVRHPRAPAELVGEIARGGPAVIALSGGVDSAVVASLAHEALGDDCLALTLTGPAVARAEVERAERVARAIGIPHQKAPADVLANARYRANPTDRCYFCRSVETAAVRTVGEVWGARQYLDGVQVDDLEDDRPGLRAMDEAGFRHPLVWGGWGKFQVREAARDRHLPNWDQPSDACLASRVAHGDPITAALLERIESGEAWIASRGFRRVRIRTHGDAARVEVDPSEVERLRREPLRSELEAALHALGYGSVEVDPEGYGARPRGSRGVA